MSECHIVGNLMPRLIYIKYLLSSAKYPLQCFGSLTTVPFRALLLLISLFNVHLIDLLGFCVWPLLCYALLKVLYSFAILLTRKR